LICGGNVDLGNSMMILALPDVWSACSDMIENTGAFALVGRGALPAQAASDNRVIVTIKALIIGSSPGAANDHSVTRASASQPESL
jgi:hypothetical protein